MNLLAVEVDKFLLLSHVCKKILARVNHRDEQQLKKARCEGGFFMCLFVPLFQVLKDGEDI